MNKDRISGAAKQAKGAVQESAGKAIGHSNLVAEGKTNKGKGKIQGASAA